MVGCRSVDDGRVVQRQVLYLGEINDGQRAAWSKAIEVFDEGAGQSKQIALFPEDRLAPVLDCDVVSIRLSTMRLRQPRQWGADPQSPVPNLINIGFLVVPMITSSKSANAHSLSQSEYL
jgi:hypothetical protein